jgi:S-adenosylmethionine uptake transporter
VPADPAAPLAEPRPRAGAGPDGAGIVSEPPGGLPAPVPASPAVLTRAITLMLLGAALFAAMATFVGLAHRRDPGLSTFTSSMFRSVVNVLALVAISWRDPRALFGDARPALWARGMFGGVALLTYFAAIPYLSVGEAAFLNQTSALWVALFAPWMLGQATGGLAWFAILGSLAGVALLAHPRPDGADLLGRVLGLVSGMAAAAAYISVRKAAATNRPIVIVFWFTLVSSIASITLAVTTGASLPRDPVTVLFLVGAGLSATVAQLLMTTAYRDGHAASVAAAGAAGPLLTAGLGWLLLEQVPDGRALVGMAILFVTSAVLPFWAARARAG